MRTIASIIASVVDSMPKHIVDIMRKDVAPDWVWLEENLGRALEDEGYAMPDYLDAIEPAKALARIKKGL